MRAAGLQKFTTAFRLSRKKRRKRTFSARKTRILRNFRLNVWQKASVVSLDGK